MRSAFEKGAAAASTPCYSIWTDEPWRQRDPAPSRDRRSNFFSCAQDITQVDRAYERYVEDITETPRYTPTLNERHWEVEGHWEMKKKKKVNIQIWWIYLFI